MYTHRILQTVYMSSVCLSIHSTKAFMLFIHDLYDTTNGHTNAILKKNLCTYLGVNTWGIAL